MGYKVVILLALFTIGCETQKVTVDNTPYAKLGYGFAASVWAYQVYAVPERETPDKQIPNDVPDSGQAIGTPNVELASPKPIIREVLEPEPLIPQKIELESKPEPAPTNPHVHTPITPEFTAEPPPAAEPAIKERLYRLLYFKGDNCPNCELFEKGSKNADGTVRNKAYYKWLKDGGWTIGLDTNNHIQEINADRDVAMRTKYNIESYPTFVLIDNNKEIDRLVGYHTGEKIVDFYNKGKK